MGHKASGHPIMDAALSVPTIKDVARLARTSTATVSAVINASSFVSAPLKARVREAIAQLGYEPSGIARSLRTQATRLIGLIVPDITNPFFAELVRALGSAAQARGYMTLLCETDSDPAKELAALHLLAAHQADGVILAPTGPAEMYFVPPLSTFRKPLVMVDRVVPGAPFDSVAIDNHRAAFELTQYLLALGHTRVGIIAGTPHLSNTIERLAGFRDALTARGLQVVPAHVAHADFREDRARELCRRLLAVQDPPTALFVSNNQMLIGTMRAITDLSLVCPDDISLAAIDDFPWAATFTPKLTTQRQPIAGLAEHAVRLLHARMLEGHMQGARRAAETVVLRTELVIRESCAPPKPARETPRNPPSALRAPRPRRRARE
jgi:LacI family transcriptional regulator